MIRLAGLKKSFGDQRVLDGIDLEALRILALVGMEWKRDAYPIQLSGGEAQRIGIGRALAVHAPIMLFDEPTSSLDPERVREVLDVIRLLAEKRHTMLIVTHELEFARRVVTRIAFMNEGRIAALGVPEEIWTDANPRLRRFLESRSKKEWDLPLPESGAFRLTFFYRWGINTAQGFAIRIRKRRKDRMRRCGFT